MLVTVIVASTTMAIVRQERIEGPQDEPGVFAACASCLINVFRTSDTDNSGEMAAQFLASEHQKKNPLHLLVVGIIHRATGK